VGIPTYMPIELSFFSYVNLLKGLELGFLQLCEFPQICSL